MGPFTAITIGIIVVGLVARCVYLEYVNDTLIAENRELGHVLHKTQLALTDRIMQTWPNGEPPTEKYPKPLSGCNDPERLAG